MRRRYNAIGFSGYGDATPADEKKPAVNWSNFGAALGALGATGAAGLVVTAAMKMDGGKAVAVPAIPALGAALAVYFLRKQCPSCTVDQAALPAFSPRTPTEREQERPSLLMGGSGPGVRGYGDATGQVPEEVGYHWGWYALGGGVAALLVGGLAYAARK
jgi:hypothetical protein